MDQAILREYLVALGFRVNETQEKKFVGGLKRANVSALAVGKGLVGVATAAVTMAHVFARQMEKVYYAARYADTTAGSLQALEYGTRNIGLEAGRGANALKNMSAAIRGNPGLVGLLNSLGVEVKGRDKADVLIDLVGALKKMPFYVAERYANLFGIDQETLFMLQEGLDKMKAAQAERKKMADEMGVDAERQSEVAKEYMGIWRELTERAGLFGMVLSEKLLPYMKELGKETNNLLTKWGLIVGDIGRPGAAPFGQRMREGLTGAAEGDRVTLTPEAKARLGAPKDDLPDVSNAKGARHSRLYQKWLRWRDKRSGRNRYGPQASTDADAVDAATDDSAFKGKGGIADSRDPDGEQNVFDPKVYMANLERKYNLPPGILGRVWKRESNEGDPRFMRSKAGAMGHFGFMPKTAKEYGLNDPDDFTQSADAAARKWRDLLKRYGGDTRMAAAAYNWGDGNLAKYGLGRAPSETRGYMDAVAGGTTIEANPQIHIHGVSEPEKAAESVVRAQRSVNADLVRNYSPKVR